MRVFERRRRRRVDGPSHLHVRRERRHSRTAAIAERERAERGLDERIEIRSAGTRPANAVHDVCREFRDIALLCVVYSINALSPSESQRLPAIRYSRGGAVTVPGVTLRRRDLR